MKLRLRFDLLARARGLVRVFWYRATEQIKGLPATNLALRLAALTTSWLLVYIVPAIATGLVFAAALGRYTTETQFAQNAFQNYLRPYQTQFRSCLIQMDTLRERWENLQLMLQFAGENSDPSAPAPIVVFTHEGSISFDMEDDAERVLSRIVIASRRASTCIDETIRQAGELASLLGRKNWFDADVSNREQRMAEYQGYISKNWSSIAQLSKWEVVEAAIKRARDSEVPSLTLRDDSRKYYAAVERVRAHLFEAHARHKDWFEKLDVTFRDELTARSSRSVGYYLGSIAQDVIPLASQQSKAALAAPPPSLAWTTATDKNPPAADCSCSRPFAGGAYQRIGDPP